MSIEIILLKARMHCSYCASQELFADLTKVKPVLFHYVLELFGIWEYWHIRRHLAVELNAKTVSHSREELLQKQKVVLEYNFLNFDFMHNFKEIVPEEAVVCEDVKIWQIGPLQSAKEILLMQDFLKWMAAYKVYDGEAVKRLENEVKWAVLFFGGYLLFISGNRAG